jgi:hypothetical protein
MLPEIHKIKNTPPSIIIFHELEKTKCSLEKFMESTGFSKETFDNITPEISSILGEKFKVSATYFLEIQEKFEKSQKENKNTKTKIPKINKFIFWDTDFDKLDWIRYKKSIIKRIFERGFEEDKIEIISFYGKESILKTLKELNQKIDNETIQTLYKYSIPITFGKFLQDK